MTRRGARPPGDTAEKLIIGLEDPSPGGRDDFVSWARAMADSEGIGRAEIEWLDDDAQQAHTAKSPRFFGFASFWVLSPFGPELWAALPGPATWFVVRERLAFDRSAGPDDAGSWVGVKKTTPWAPVEGVDRRTWQGRYTNHGLIAASYHATCVRYRQNVVIDSSDPSLGAVSELWWTNVEDLVERFYRDPEAEALLAVDTSGFVDVRRAYPTVTRHETLRVGLAATSQRGFI